MNRRFFLKATSGALLAAPFLTSLRRTASAQASPAPQRSVIFHSPCGCLTDRWFPKVEDGSLNAAALQGTTLEVLTPHVNKLLFPRGLRAMNEYGKPQFIDPHSQAMGSKLTCSLITTDSTRYATSHSVDYEIARQVNPGGALPLVLGVGPLSTKGLYLLSYSAANTPRPANTSVANVYSQLSGVLVGDAGEAEYRLKRGQSIIDAVRDDLASYQRQNMSQADQHRVSAWLDLLRDTEHGVQAAACAESNVGLDADAVTQANAGTTLAEAFTVGADTMIKLMALSLLCDTNRSLILTFPGYVVFDWDGIHHVNDHDALAHRNGDGQTGGQCLPGVLDMLAQIDGWYAAKYAKLVSLLDGLSEGDGTLLDNTATMWIQEFSDGNMDNLNNMPIVIAGGAGGYLKQGVAVNVEGKVIGPGNSDGCCLNGGTITMDTGSVGGNVPINKLYVTLMNAVGCKAPDGGPVTTFGVFDGDTAEAGITSPGELSALRA